MPVLIVLQTMNERWTFYAPRVVVWVGLRVRRLHISVLIDLGTRAEIDSRTNLGYSPSYRT